MKVNEGHFGQFGGRYVPEMLIPALEELEKMYFKAKKDKGFQKEFNYHLKTYEEQRFILRTKA
jgi:tryptophan synthase beta chain